MHSYTRNMLALLLAFGSASITTPSLAQTSIESNKENTNNIVTVSSQSTSATDTGSSSLSDSDSSTNSKPVILSDSDSNANSAKVAATNPNPRTPIFSRIFPAPSMQQ